MKIYLGTPNRKIVDWLKMKNMLIVTLIDNTQKAIDYTSSNLNINAITSIDATVTQDTLKSIDQIPSHIDIFGSWAFSYCSQLMTVHIPDGMTTIGYGAFAYCSSLRSIDIPQSIVSIELYAFHYCSMLTSFTVAESNPSYVSLNNLLCTKDRKTLIAGVNGDVIIPNGIEIISKYAFGDRRKLNSVKIPAGVIDIEERAFSTCSSLTTITIPSSVTNIGSYAFYGCNELIEAKFEGKTLSQIKNMKNYAYWQLDENIIVPGIKE